MLTIFFLFVEETFDHVLATKYIMFHYVHFWTGNMGDILNSASADRTSWKLTLQTSTRHRKNSKQSGIVAIDSCFALFGARQYGATTRESSDFKPWPRTLNTHRITPYHVSSVGQVSIKNMDRTMQELQYIASTLWNMGRRMNVCILFCSFITQITFFFVIPEICLTSSVIYSKLKLIN